MTVPTVPIPPGLGAQRRLGAGWASWLDRLPGLTRALLEQWDLAPAGAAMHGWCSLVVPVEDEAGERAALKISFDGDEESLHEGLTLQRWGGRGAVRLLRAEPHRRALLLEWLPGPDLTDAWDIEACEVVAGLYADLHVAAPPQLRTVASYAEQWLADLAALGTDVPMPRRLVDQALALGRDLVAGAPGTASVVHGDLHYANVLQGRGGEWLAIDPKPMSGDPHYDVAPMLWNRMDELIGPAAVGTVRDGVRRRFHAIVDAAGLDQDRARDWVVVRAVVNASWSVLDARREGRGLDVGESDWLTRCITVAKAVQD